MKQVTNNIDLRKRTTILNMKVNDANKKILASDDIFRSHEEEDLDKYHNYVNLLLSDSESTVKLLETFEDERTNFICKENFFRDVMTVAALYTSSEANLNFINFSDENKEIILDFLRHESLEDIQALSYLFANESLLNKLKMNNNDLDIVKVALARICKEVLIFNKSNQEVTRKLRLSK